MPIWRRMLAAILAAFACGACGLGCGYCLCHEREKERMRRGQS